MYIDQPKSFVVPGQEKKIYKLAKSLYGLKQALRQQNENFDQVMLFDDFQTNIDDKCFYTKTIKHDYVVLCLYVDDIMIFYCNIQVINITKYFLFENIDMKDFGVVKFFLALNY